MPGDAAMLVVNFSEARNSLKGVMDQVIDDADYTVIARCDASDAVLIKDCLHHPFDGVGKPEPLKENLSGFWSRRIDDTHRLVYAVDDSALVIIACRYHYH